MKKELVKIEELKVYFIRDQYVILDKDLAKLYQVETRYINYARKRSSEVFKDISFRITKKEKESLESKMGIRISANQNMPIAFTEEACYKLSSYLRSPIAAQVADLMYQSFKAFKDKKVIILNNHHQIDKISKSIEEISEKIKGFNQNLIQNNYNAPVNYIQGDNAVLNISNGASENFLMGVAQLMMDSKVAQNQEIIGVLSKVLESQSKKDKDGVLDNLKKLVDIGAGISSIATGVPALIEIVKKLF
jgi:hypothetical protein